jgi:hypothetical protein
MFPRRGLRESTRNKDEAAAFKHAEMLDVVMFFVFLVVALAAVIVPGFVWNAATDLSTTNNIILWILLVAFVLIFWLHTTGGVRVVSRGMQRVLFNLRYVNPSTEISNIYQNKDTVASSLEYKTLKSSVSSQVNKVWPYALFEASWILLVAFATYAWFAAWDQLFNGTNLAIYNDPPFDNDSMGDPRQVFIAINALWLAVFVLMALWRQTVLRSPGSMLPGVSLSIAMISAFLAFGCALAALILSYSVWTTAFGLAFIPVAIILAYGIYFHIYAYILYLTQEEVKKNKHELVVCAGIISFHMHQSSCMEMKMKAYTPPSRASRQESDMP